MVPHGVLAPSWHHGGHCSDSPPRLPGATAILEGVWGVIKFSRGYLWIHANLSKYTGEKTYGAPSTIHETPTTQHQAPKPRCKGSTERHTRDIHLKPTRPNAHNELADLR
jgi:hypothetical protein